MGTYIYKVNSTVRIIFQALGGQTGITDLAVTVYDPSNTPTSLGNMTELSNGLYEKTFIPSIKGRWFVLISSATYPANAVKESYFIGDQDEVPGIIIQSADGNYQTSIIPDGDIHRLAVDANVTGGVALQRFTPKFYYNTIGTSLNTSTDTELFNVDANAQLDFINITSSSSSYEIALFIDGLEEFRLSMLDLGSTLSLANETNVPLWVETANKNFRFSPREPIDFQTNLTIKAKSISGTVTVYTLVNYRKLA